MTIAITKKSVENALAGGAKANAEAICAAILGPHRSGRENDSYHARHVQRAQLCLDAIERANFARKQYERAKK